MSEENIIQLDFSEEMLNSAKRSFSNSPNIKYLKEDFIEIARKS